MKQSTAEPFGGRRLRDRRPATRQPAHSPEEVVVLDRMGRAQFATRRARHWLAEYFGLSSRGALSLPHALQAWIKNQNGFPCKKNGRTHHRKPFFVELGRKRLGIRMVSRRNQPFSVLLLDEEPLPSPAELAESHLRLTRREAEVLAWTGQGKTNAEIGKILGRSPRTVGKHLEHIYQKLGVETRTAAVLFGYLS